MLMELVKWVNNMDVTIDYLFILDLIVSIMFVVSFYSLSYKYEVNRYLNKDKTVELTGIAIVSTVLLYNLIPIASIFILNILYLTSITDKDHKEVPDSASMAILLLTIMNPNLSIHYLILNLVIAVIMMVSLMVCRIGGGDFKIFVAISFALGYNFMLISVFLMAVYVLVVVIIPNISNKDKSGLGKVPLMPYYLMSVLTIILSGVI